MELQGLYAVKAASISIVLDMLSMDVWDKGHVIHDTDGSRLCTADNKIIDRCTLGSVAIWSENQDPLETTPCEADFYADIMVAQMHTVLVETYSSTRK